ncbi:Utp14 protein-domain-containing protein [Russula compacta]|nr:Utp14 protein-domain-containing protein [Russula compacta]
MVKRRRSSVAPLSSRSSTSSRRSNHLRNSALSDVYEYQSHKVRRAHIPLSLDKEEAREYGADSDSDTTPDIRKPRLIGESVEDEDVPSEDDEELDSDAAFEESDEDRFAGFSFPKSRSNISRKPPAGDASDSLKVDFNDGDSMADSEEADDSGDYINVLDVLDGGADSNTEEMDLANQAHAKSLDSGSSANIGVMEERDTKGEEEGDVEEAQEEDEEDEQDLMSSADEDVNPSALEGLEKFVSSLETSRKRKGECDLTNNSIPRKKRFVEERTAVGVEGEYTAVTSGQQLRLDDLLAPLASHSSAVLSLKKSVKVLDSSQTRGALLPAPLPHRTQDRLDREAAYEQTKTEVDRWNETMRQIKEAEHLSFPLQAEPVGKVSNLELTAKFKPSTEMEKAVDQLLKRAQMKDEDLQKTEELKMNHLSAEEVAARRAEIMKTRELMFRAEMKAKRIAKIKSKTYRRLKRREKERHLGEESGSEGPEASLKREAKRAKERATLRHKSTGKWAKMMRRRGEMDANQRQDMVEMLERGEKLRRKIQGSKGSSDSDDDDDDDNADSLAQLKARVFDELAELKRDDSGPGKVKGKSVFDMKFMQDAAAREQREIDQKVDDLMEELQNLDAPAYEDEAVGPELPQDDCPVVIQRTGGRVSLRPSGLTPILMQRPAPSDASSTTLKSTDIHSLPTTTPTMSPVDPHILSVSQSQFTQQTGGDYNPWLSRDDRSSHTTLKKNEIAVSKDSSSAVKGKNKLRKRQRETQEAVTKVQDDAVLEISPADLLVASFKGSQQAEPGDSSSDEDGEVEEQEERLKRKDKPPARAYHAFEQKELVTKAFAGDNVVEEFEETKRREVESDAPQEVDTSLPGWGAWGGQGTRKTLPKPHLLKGIAGINPQSRADFGKAHVIISEKRDKKAAKYLTKDLPYPYTSKAQFERTLETPIGREWNTRIASQRATLPKVTKKMGAIIRPLEKRF